MSERPPLDRLANRPEYGSPQDIINDYERFIAIVEWFASEASRADQLTNIKKRTMLNSLLLKRGFDLDDPEKNTKFIKIAKKAYQDLEEQKET